MLKIKKILSSLSIAGLVFLQLLPLGASAFTIPDSLITSFSDTSSSNNPISGASNQTGGISNKEQGPKVDVSFEGGMQQGAKITASAVPSFFNGASDPKKLYFTWYLKRSGCDLTNSPDEQIKSKCDFDSNGRITVNDWKIAAAKIIVDGSFDSSNTDYTKAVNESLAGYKAMPSPLGEWSINSGADENDKDAPNCYVQSPKSGLVYELRKTTEFFDNNCPSGYHSACVADVAANCDVLNPEYNPVPTNQAAINAAIANGEIPPSPVYNAPKSIVNAFGACSMKTEESSGDKLGNIYDCVVRNDADMKDFRSTVSCKDDKNVSICVKNDVKDGNSGTDFLDTTVSTSVLIGRIFGIDVASATAAENDSNGVCATLAKPNTNSAGSGLGPKPDFLSNASPLISKDNEKCSTLKDELVNGTKDASGIVLIAGNKKIEPTCTFNKDANMCKHLFPTVPGSVSGDGKFTLAEKKFWGADPSKVSTNGSGKDEENVVGLGVDKFSWMFSPGDQVGVVVEGDSAFPTEHADSSYKRMWAFSKGVCDALDNIESKSSIKNETRSFYLEGPGGLNCDPLNKQNCSGIFTTNIDLNDCLEENLLDPDADSKSKLAVQLNVDPANPINDPSGRGDTVTVSSTSTNTQDQGGLLYTWSVQKSRDGSIAPVDTTSWLDITNDMKSADVNSFTDADILGLGKKDLAINMNLPESLVTKGWDQATIDAYNKGGGAFYIKVKVKIKGGAVDGSQNAEGSVQIRVTGQQNELVVYPVIASNAGMLSLNNSNGITPFCDDKAGKSRCYVTKNEILGITIPKNSKSGTTPFSWTVNGNAISCLPSTSTQCAGGNVLFFPILGNDGEAVDVVAKGSDKNGEAIQISRHFVIVPPQVQIIAQDANVWPKLLGYYKDLDNNRTPDYSTQVLETNPGKTVTLGAAFYPAWKAGQAGFDWAIDGQIMPQYQNQNQIQFPVEKMSGESYNIGLVALYSPGSTDQVNNIRKALLKNWGISPEDVIEQNDTANIQLNVVDSSPETVASAEKNGSLSASLITHLPEQLMFLFKISLTSVLILLMTGLLFAFIPETLFKEEK
ncbi:MAG: hypothetical protein PHW24_03910 [Candidatus Moranbacteria bacterium]|nr:hypothetical protein [Candidatus Moranbacteria bacterium]